MMFVRAHTVAVLRRFLFPAPTLVKYHASNPSKSFITSTSCSALSTSRALSTGWTLKKDAPEHKPELDLDVWKSVMRSQASQNEKPKDGEEETTAAEEEDEERSSPVEASRTLVDMWRQAGKQVPENITDEQLETLAELTTKSSKRKYLKYLAIKEGHKKANKEKKEKKRAERLAEMNKEEEGRADRLEDAEEEGEGELKFKNTYLLQFWTRSVDRALGWRAAQAMQYGQPLVYDMSYDQHMTRREMENTISQLMETEGWNRRSVDPFHLHFCNLQPEGAYQRELLKRYGQETWDRLFITATSQRHIDVFPREDLVYLTADSPNVLHTFDHSKVYIIGAMVDRSIQSGVSLANAKRLKISTARLPLDEYLHWEIGAKNLTLDQMIRILMTAKETGSWKKALEFVPKRKHDGFHQQRSKDSVQRTEKASKPMGAFRANAEGERSQIFVSKQRQKNLNRSSVASKPTFGSENISGQSRLRIALKSKLEERGKVASKRNWWEEE
ncbi:tRNA methyltransferase 10 homolog C [Pangasianodon hypophthalmus]|uniref:tRNA methyltransferase 10 homolog C n=1 Tax=Pangasianodon hypophthalmus TaxID=310915 RepID=UPI002307C56C|nr:tRNA methyltransferase 10 homolog C [Pangasianodon hypophthalmus]